MPTVSISGLLKLAAWGLVAAVAFATIGPPRYRPMTHLGQAAEHAMAFVLLGILFGLAYPRRPWLTALVGIAATGGLELLQFLAPGRHARLGDFIVDASALCIGLAVAAVLRLGVARLRGQRPD
jgi:VanZ family protein